MIWIFLSFDLLVWDYVFIAFSWLCIMLWGWHFLLVLYVELGLLKDTPKIWIYFEIFFRFLIWSKVLLGLVVWAIQYLWSLSVCRTAFQNFLNFRDSTKQSVTSLMGLPWYGTQSVSLEDLIILLLFWICSILIILWCRKFLFWCNLCSIIYASFAFRGIPFFRLGNFSS